MLPAPPPLPFCTDLMWERWVTYFIQLIILNHPNISLCLLYVFLVSMLSLCLFLSNNAYRLTELHFKIAVLTVENR